MGARFGQEILEAMTWAKRQKKATVKVVPTFGDARFMANSDVYGHDADEIDQIPELGRKLRSFDAYLTFFTSGDANKDVRNSGDGRGLEAWRRLHNEYDPTSSMRRVTILRAGTKRDPNAMEVDALSKGGQSKSGKGKIVTWWVCNKTGHMSRDCYCYKGKSKRKGKSDKASKDC